MISIRSTSFNGARELSDFLNAPDNRGATASFIGTVRPGNDTQEVVSLFLEHHPTLSEKSVEQIAQDAGMKWNLIRYLIIHRIGLVDAGEDIVLVAATALHRRDAFDAVDFMMDHLKSEALFWKKQIMTDREEWIEPTQQDYQYKQRWSNHAGDR
ncbi:MAG: molybdenum cofactor biosynthesis protein MoaE [Aquisalinus sp.]|nr:molybdenum cofactor biosynthesis protein MoaE [Aquisalinus sp.]